MRIMLAEDNPGDVLLFREAMRSSNVPYELIVADDGEKALKLLEKAGMPDSSARPDLIVLDINLPKRSGQEVLRWVRGNPGLATVPVMILTSSASPDDKTQATRLGADLYVQKSSNLDDIFAIGATVQRLVKGRPAEH
jgi:two-component system, chemotaxis family, response regulator Rcp1